MLLDNTAILESLPLRPGPGTAAGGSESKKETKVWIAAVRPLKTCLRVVTTGRRDSFDEVRRVEGQDLLFVG
jgi:hypothetical protein